MDLVISHDSALRFLDLCARKAPPSTHQIEPIPYPGGLPYECACCKRDFKEFALERFACAGKPIDVLVPDKSFIRRVGGFALHSAGGTLPDGSLLDAGGGVITCSAPMLFIQLSQGKSLIDCIKLGFFLCATYSLEPSSRTGTVERSALAEPKDLDSFVKGAHYLRGARNAAAALPWVLEGSASPMETELALKFFLPHELGGLGFERPIMNHPVPLTALGQKILHKEIVRVDVCWPEHGIGLEYDSEAEHGTVEKHGDDQARALVLESMGIHVESVTKKQVDDPRQLKILANMLRSYGVKPASDQIDLPRKRSR